MNDLDPVLADWIVTRELSSGHHHMTPALAQRISNWTPDQGLKSALDAFDECQLDACLYDVLGFACELRNGRAPQKLTDNPVECVCPVTRHLGILLNDQSDSARARLQPYAVRLLTMDTSPDLVQRRMFIFVDWTCRTMLPMVLRWSGLEERAVNCESLAEIVDSETASHASHAASYASHAAADAAHAAAAAAHASYASHAAYAAASHAAAAAAAASASHAASAAASHAAAVSLQDSEFALLERLISV